MQYRIILFTLSHLSLIVSTSCQSENVENSLEGFLTNKLEKFPLWLQDNNLDPSPPNSKEVDLSSHSTNNFTITVTVRDEQVVGYSNTSYSSNLYGLNVNIRNGTIEFGLWTHQLLTFHGNYSANGTLITGVPILGDGKWVFVSHLYLTERFGYNFEVTLDGHIEILGNPSTYFMDLIKPVIHFDRLLDNGAGGFANEIRDYLRSKYLSRITSWFPEHPTASLIHQYITTVFKETPIADMYGYKIPLLHQNDQSSKLLTSKLCPPCPSCKFQRQVSATEIKI